MGKPLLIYDGKCGFCRIWVDYWRTLTGEEVDFAPSQEVAERFPQIPREAFGQAVQLVRADGSVASGARAVFETLGREQLYESSRGLAFVSEAAYRFIARRRSLFYQLTRFTFGPKAVALSRCHPNYAVAGSGRRCCRGVLPLYAN